MFYLLNSTFFAIPEGVETLFCQLLITFQAASQKVGPPAGKVFTTLAEAPKGFLKVSNVLKVFRLKVFRCKGFSS